VRENYYLTAQEYRQLEKVPNIRAILNRFGTWKQAKELSIKMVTK